MRRILILLLVLLVVLVGCGWAALQHAGAVQMERVAEVFGPVAFLRSQHLGADLDGVAKADQVEIIANDQRYFRQLYAESLALQGDGPVDLISQGFGASLPMAGRFELRALGLRATPAPLQIGPHWWFSFTTLMPLETVACNYLDEPVEGSYTARGYPPIHHDWRLIQQRQGELQSLRLLLDNGGMGYTEVDAQVEGLDWAAAIDGRQDLNQVMLHSLSLSWPDSAVVMSERNTLCAQRRKTDVDGYLALHQTALEEMFAGLGLVPDPPLLELLMAYARGEGSLLLEAQPKQPVSLGALLTLPLAERLARLRMVARLDQGTPVALRLNPRAEGPLQFDGRQAVDTPATSSGAKGGLRARSAKVAQALPVAAEPAEQSPWPGLITVDSAGQHLGAELRVATMNGRQYRGVLQEIDAKTLTLVVRMGGGEATFPVPLTQIKSIERLR